MAEGTKNLCARIPAVLHARVRQEQTTSGKTLDNYMTWLITTFYEQQEGKSTMKEDQRTVAFQVDTELFDRFKAYLERHNKKQRAFFVNCMLRALEEDEAEAN